MALLGLLAPWLAPIGTGVFAHTERQILAGHDTRSAVVQTWDAGLAHADTDPRRAPSAPGAVLSEFEASSSETLSKL